MRVGLKPIERLRGAVVVEAEVKTEQRRPLSGVNGEVRSKKDLTGPTLLEMSGYDSPGVSQIFFQWILWPRTFGQHVS